MKARFGSYCEVSEFDDITNTQKDRSKPAMCLGPTGNMQGTYKFFSLITGHVIKRRNFDVLPYPDRMIKKVNEWGRISKILEDDLIFKNRNNEDYSWLDDDLDLIDDNAVEPAAAPFPDIAAEIPGIQLERDQTVSAVEAPPIPSE